MKQHIIVVILTITGCFLWGCKKQLSVFPTTSEVDGNVIVDKKSAQTALNGIYYLFANAGFDNNQNPSILWYTVNETIPSELSGMCTYPLGGSEFADHTYNSASYNVDAIWSYGYKIVNAANGFIKNIEPVQSISETEKKKMIAEARFLRAFGNQELLFYYGQYQDQSSPYGIILRDEFVTVNDINLPRSSVQEAYKAIIADIDYAIANLDDRNSQGIYYANKWTAMLLKARVLINRRGDGDNAVVINLCKDIIANSAFSLEEHVKDVFLTKGLSSSEVMLGIKPYPNETYKYNQYLYYYQDIASGLMISMFTGDPRAQWVIQPVFYPYTGSDISAITKYYPGDAATSDPVAIANNSYAMRLTEAYLLEAEAIAASGEGLSEAKSLLKTVLQHAGYSDFSKLDEANTAEEMRVLIIKEEMKNFVAEAGQDWQAIRRLPFATLQQLVPTVKSKDLLILPIPQDEIKRNNQIKQNPGYGN